MYHSRTPNIPSLSEDIKKSLIVELKQFISAEDDALKLGITPKQRQAILQQQTSDFTIEALVGMLLLAGKHIHFSIVTPCPDSPPREDSIE